MTIGGIRGGGPLWAKMDSNLDTNHKIVRAGKRDPAHSRFTREIYLFVLRRNWIHGARGGVPGRDVDTWYMSRMLFMPEPEARIGLECAIEVELLDVPEIGDSLRSALRSGVTDRDDLLRVTEAPWVSIVGWDQLWSAMPRSNAERQKAFRERHKGRIPTNHRNGALRVVTDSNGSNAIEENRREDLDQETLVENAVPAVAATTRKSKADRIEDRAWRAADALRSMVLGMFPSANIGSRPWDNRKRPPSVVVGKIPGKSYAADTVEVPDLGKCGNRLKWADEIRLMVEQDGRTYDAIWHTLMWLRHKQPAGVHFIVQSPSALRDKWGQIWAHIEAPQRARDRSDDAVDGAVDEIKAAVAARGTT